MKRQSKRTLESRAAALMIELREIRTELLRREQRKAKIADIVIEHQILEIAKRRKAA